MGIIVLALGIVYQKPCFEVEQGELWHPMNINDICVPGAKTNPKPGARRAAKTTANGSGLSTVSTGRGGFAKKDIFRAT